MRRTHVIFALCLLLLFVPIYLWKVQGITFFCGGAPATPSQPYDATKDAPHDDFVELLRESLIKYKSSGVAGYRCTFVMHEKVNGKLKPPEVIECWFQEKPFSVLMHWKEGANKVAASLYVEGENDGKMCIRPAGALERTFAATVTRKVDCDEAKASARYRITEFGVRCGTERTYKAWKALKDRGVKLNIEYQGIQQIAEVGGRSCHVVKRICNEPEEEGMTDVTVYLDVETMMQVGSVLKAGNELIGEYYFKDIVINPKFEPNQFKQEILKQY
jgi:hypothetical protein